MSWYVLYTKPRTEKKIAALIAQRGIEVYCPLHETIRQWSDRKKKIQEPLFRSYIFVALEDYEKEHVSVLKIPGTVRFLWWQKKPGVVREEEIDAIRLFLNDYKGTTLSIAFTGGEEVTVIEGKLKNQTGKIIRVKGNKVLLQIHSLGWNVIADLPVQVLQKN